MDEMLPEGSNEAHNVVTILFMVDRNTFPPVLWLSNFRAAPEAVAIN